MKIALVTASCGCGGMERHIGDLARELSRDSDNEVVLIAPEAQRRIAHPRCQFVAVGLERSRWLPGVAGSLRDALEQVAPDVVHAHGRKAATLLAQVSKRAAYKTIVTYHNLKTLPRSVASRFDERIAVSSLVADQVRPDHTHLVYNGVG